MSPSIKSQPSASVVITIDKARLCRWDEFADHALFFSSYFDTFKPISSIRVYDQYSFCSNFLFWGCGVVFFYFVWDDCHFRPLQRQCNWDRNSLDLTSLHWTRPFTASVHVFTGIFKDQRLKVVIDFVNTCNNTKGRCSFFLSSNLILVCFVRIHSTMSSPLATIRKAWPALDVPSLLVLC